MGAPLRNVFACLVHECAECVVDLVRNLRYLDPDSAVLVYNGGKDAGLLARSLYLERYGAIVHPAPRPLRWGWLHEFALDCMRFALGELQFDLLTIVDSDQLGTQPGYSAYLTECLARRGRVGLLGVVPDMQPARRGPTPIDAAVAEIELWRPFLRRFPGGERNFAHWTFWPSTVFTVEAARDLTKLFAGDQQLAEIMRRSRIWATEEVVLPTLVALLGYEVAANPCSYDYVRYRATYSAGDVDAALSRPDVFWMHPIARRYDNPLRRLIRERHRHYERSSPMASRTTGGAADLLLTVPILASMRRVEGWLEEDEADLLIETTRRALADTPVDAAVVEVGSYCGRSTVVLGSAVRQLRSPGKVYAVDPHDGVVGALDQGLECRGSTFDRFWRNVTAAGLADVVEAIAKPSFEVSWDRSISLLLIDGLHDYMNVARDFHHFERWIVDGGHVAFHDYADYYPGVKTFVNELLASGRYELVACVRSMIVVRKPFGEAGPDAGEAMVRATAPSGTVTAEPAVVAPSASTAVAAPNRPLVSCIMPTANRRPFVPQAIQYFLRQDYPERELIVIDDGEDPVRDLMPSDSRVRYVRLARRRSMGAKHNLAVELARGEIVCHWDDDDWLADWRISYQVRELVSRPAMTICGLSHLLYYDPRTSCAWDYVYPPAARPWVSGATLCYRRAFLERHRFPDMSEGADTVFVWNLTDAEVVAHADQTFFVGIVHPNNTSAKRTDTRGWRALVPDVITRLIGPDLAFYGTFRAAQRTEP